MPRSSILSMQSDGPSQEVSHADSRPSSQSVDSGKTRFQPTKHSVLMMKPITAQNI